VGPLGLNTELLASRKLGERGILGIRKGVSRGATVELSPALQRWVG